MLCDDDAVVCWFLLSSTILPNSRAHDNCCSLPQNQKTPLDIASEKGHRQIVDLINKVKADLESLLRSANIFGDEGILLFVLDQLLAAPNSFDFFDSTTAQQRESLIAATTELDCQSTSQKTTKCVDELIKRLKSPSLKKWAHSFVLLALAYSSPTHFKLYESHARRVS